MKTVDRSRLPTIGAPVPFKLPRIQKHQLVNGLRLWTVEHHGVPVTTFVFLVPSGSAEDPSGRPGLAALTGDMLDEGSGGLSAIDIRDALARIGAHFDTEVGPDSTTLTLSVISRFAARGLALLGEMAVRPRFDEKDFERVRQLRLNRLLQLRDLPPVMAERAFARLLYGDHPYGHLPSGTEEGLESAEPLEPPRFHERVYRPSSATLIVVGDLDHGRAVEMAEEVFGGWQKAQATAADGTPGTGDVAGKAPALAVLNRPRSAQSELRIGHIAAARSTPDYYPLLVLNMILGGQFVSRINLNLREDKGYTYGARTSFDFRRLPGPFVLQVSVQTEVTAAAALEALAELQSIRTSRPATPAELELAVAALTRGYARNFETTDQIARAIGHLALYQLPEDHYERFVERVTEVGLDSVHDVAVRYIDPARLTTLVVGDSDAMEGSLDRLGLGEPCRVDPAD
jgi:zinc protease